MEAAVDGIAAGMLSSAGTFMSDFSGLLMPLLGLLAFLIVAGAFIGWMKHRG